MASDHRKRRRRRESRDALPGVIHVRKLPGRIKGRVSGEELHAQIFRTSLRKFDSPIVVSKIEHRDDGRMLGRELRGAIDADARTKRVSQRERGRRFEAAFEDVRRRSVAVGLERRADLDEKRRRKAAEFKSAQEGIRRRARQVERREARSEADAGSGCKERPENHERRGGSGSGRSFIPWCDADHGSNRRH